MESLLRDGAVFGGWVLVILASLGLLVLISAAFIGRGDE